MTVSGYLLIERKTIPFHMVENRVTLIPMPYNPCAQILPTEVKEKELICGVTTTNREIIFIGCQYTPTALAYQAYVYAKTNTGMPLDITHLDGLRFTGRPINAFSGPGNVFLSKNRTDISQRMLSLTPKPWHDINKEFSVRLGVWNTEVNISYYISHNLKFEETSIGTTIPRFDILFPRKVRVQNVPKIYLWVYDFFSFLNFKRNIVV